MNSEYKSIVNYSCRKKNSPKYKIYLLKIQLFPFSIEYNILDTTSVKELLTRSEVIQEYIIPMEEFSKGFKLPRVYKSVYAMVRKW